MIQWKNILAPTDFSDLSLVGLNYAVSLAQSSGATLHCVHVLDESYQYWITMGPEGVPAGPSFEELFAQARQAMVQFKERQLSGVSVPVVTDILAGLPFMEIIRYARDKSIDLIVIATHGRSGVSRWVWGSVADRILRSSCVPVLMVRAPGCVPGI